MKLITAIIRPHKLEDVRQAVGDVGVQGKSCVSAPASVTPAQF